jgi:hypothetical protein
MARAAFFEVLDRLGLVKYALATLFTLLAFVLTAGAYLIDERAKHPSRPKPPPAAWLAGPEASRPPGWAVRAPVSRTVRFSAATETPDGFSFYGITARDTPQTLAAKLGRKQFQVTRVRGETCDFAQPLSGRDAPAGPVAGFIKERGRDCCGVFSALPEQLATYGFGQGRPARGAIPAGPISGTAVFSSVGGGLLTLTMRFSEQVEGYAAAVARHMGERFGPPAALPGDGASWARNGGLVTVTRAGHVLTVTAYFAANIERHAALARELAERRNRPDTQPGGSLAMAGQP